MDRKSPHPGTRSSKTWYVTSHAALVNIGNWLSTTQTSIAIKFWKSFFCTVVKVVVVVAVVVEFLDVEWHFCGWVEPTFILRDSQLELSMFVMRAGANIDGWNFATIFQKQYHAICRI
jgi:hypothetical protein